MTHTGDNVTPEASDMNLNPHRPWITPLVIGMFMLMTVTGILMFFHLDSGLNKAAHEWLSWIMVGGVALHVVLNLPAFKRHFNQRTSRMVMALFAVVLALSFVPLAKKEPAYLGAVRALAAAPMPVLAQVAGVPVEELQHRLQAQGINAADGQRSLRELMGGNLRDQTRVLSQVMASGTSAP